MTLPQARDSLRKAGCQIGSLVHEISGKVKKYHVKAQAPRAGLTVPNGTKVTVDRLGRAAQGARQEEA